MKRTLMHLGVAALVAVFLAAVANASPGEAKWVRGKVTALGADSVTVKVRDKEWKFTVDKSTLVVARGAGTRAQAAKEEGKPGPKLSEVVKVGDGIEVRYKEEAGAMHASEIRGGVAVGDGSTSEDPPTHTRASGSVTAVSADSLSVKSADREWNFKVSSETKVMGHGAGTLTREKKAAGAVTTITDFVGVKDEVTVTYKDKDGVMQAVEVYVAKKAAKP